MTSRQLLSVVFSLIMLTGVTAGSTAFAESYDLDDLLEDFCEMNDEQQNDLFSEYDDIVEHKEKLVGICDMEDEDDRKDALEEFIDTIVVDTEDGVRYDSGGVYVDGDEGDDRDYARDGIHEDLDDKLERYCEMAEDEKLQLFTHHPKLEQFKGGLEEYCNSSDDGVKIPFEDYLEELSSPDGSGFTIKDYVEEYYSESKDAHSNKGHGNLKDHLAMYCEMTDDEKAEKMKTHHDLPDDLRDRLANYCDLSEDEQDEFRDSMMDRMDNLKDHAKDKKMDKSHMMDSDGCDLAKSDPSTGVHTSEMLSGESDWCNMTHEERNQYYHDVCDSNESDPVTGSGDSQALDGVSDWCNMMSEKREKHASGNHDPLNDETTDKAKDKSADKMDKSGVSPRLKEMIMDKRDISDERQDELKMKYVEKHGDLTDKKKSELKSKFEDHMKTMKYKISDERKSDIHDRLAEMKAFKAELREKSSELTDEQKQQLREKFIEKAKDMRLAWITPHTQMTAGVDAADVECSEGLSLVMKTSNGMAMCLKADSALKMIDRGIVVPSI